jgi:hypothetical protein
MGAFDDSKAARVLAMVVIAVAALLAGYFLASALASGQSPQQQSQEFRGVRVLEAYVDPSSVRAGETTHLTVRVSNPLNDFVDVKVMILIKGEVEKYATVSGFNVVKLSEGAWQWSWGSLPPLSEVKYVVNMAFNVPSGVAEIKYRVQVDVVANGSTIDSRTFIIQVLT